MRTSEVLNKAADLIQERGWTRGGGWLISDDPTTSPKLCLEGALQAAAGIPAVLARDAGDLSYRINHECPAGRAVRAYLADQHNKGLFLWNDHLPRTAEQVIEVLRATAVIEAARESHMADDMVALMASPA